jgi:hypothetical protein
MQTGLDCGICVDPSLLSLTGNTALLSATTKPALSTRFGSFNPDSSHLPLDPDTSWDLHGFDIFAGIEVSASSTTQNPYFSNDLYGQTSFDNGSYFPEVLNESMFNTHLHQTPPSFDSSSSPTTQDDSFTISTTASQSSAHTPTPTPSSPPSAALGSPSSPSSPNIPTTPARITCTWPKCTKIFPSVNTYKYFTLSFPSPSLTPNRHHFLTHSRPFTCPTCTLRHATKRHLSRHMNVHSRTEIYFCSVEGCERSMEGVGYSQAQRGKREAFIRIDNCRRHLRTVHGFSAEEARRCVVAQEGRLGRARG